MTLPIQEIESLGYSVEPKSYRANHLFGIRTPAKAEMEKIKKSFQKHKVSVSFRGNAIRVSPHVYNDEIDVRKLLKALKEPILA